MKITSRFCIICIGGLITTAVDTAAQWVQDSGDAGSAVAAPYSNTVGNNYSAWTTSGTLSSSRSANNVQAVATNFFGRVDSSTSYNGGSASAGESGYAYAYQYWTWTGSPGTATNRNIRSVQSLAKDPTVNFATVSSVYATAPSSGTSAGGSAFTDITANTDVISGAAVYDDSHVYTQAEADEAAGFRTWDYDLGGSNVTLSNSTLSNANSFTRAYCDYSVSIDHSFSAGSGQSSIYAYAQIGYTVYCDVYTNGNPPMFGVVPTAVSYGRVSINGHATVTVN